MIIYSDFVAHMEKSVDSSDNSLDDSSGQVKDKLKSELSNLQKICLVCGDKALGYNFNAISCESCKAFFRRNALVSKEFKCPFTNSCEITVVTRRFCQKCRLEKCIAIGMVKEFIMSDEDKAEKRKKIEENRAKKRNHQDNDETVSSSKNIKREDDNTTSYNNHRVGDVGIVQYDILNSTTCSPTSAVQSPVRTDIDVPPPVYNQYVNLNHTVDYSNQYPVYPQKKYIPVQTHITHKNQIPYEHSIPDHFVVVSSAPTVVDSTVYENQTSNDTIRSILTNGESVIYHDNKIQQHICTQLPSTSSNNPHINKARDILEDVQRIPIEPNSIESILCEAIKLEFESYSSSTQCVGSSRELNDVERAKLNELIVANKALHAPIDVDISQLIGAGATGMRGGNGGHDSQLLDIINLTAVAIRRLIKMSKKINAFKNMCEEDQVALLKGGCTEMMVLRSTMNYDGQRNLWKIPHSQEEYGNIKTDVLKLAKGNIYQAYDCFIRTFEPHWRQDENIILIMSAIVLFTPHRAKVVHSDVIKLEQNSYYYLLRRYLESVYAGCEAKSIFLKLIQKIMELHKLSDDIIGVYLDVKPIEPLLMEIFDLKQHGT